MIDLKTQITKAIVEGQARKLIEKCNNMISRNDRIENAKKIKGIIEESILKNDDEDLKNTLIALGVKL